MGKDLTGVFSGTFIIYLLFRLFSLFAAKPALSKLGMANKGFWGRMQTNGNSSAIKPCMKNPQQALCITSNKVKDHDFFLFTDVS